MPPSASSSPTAMRRPPSARSPTKWGSRPPPSTCISPTRIRSCWRSAPAPCPSFWPSTAKYRRCRSISIARVRMMLEGYVRFALAHPNTYRLVFCASPAIDSLRRQHATMQIGSQCLDRFSSVIREIAAEGRLRVGDPRTAHQAMWSACHGMVTLMIAKPDLDWAKPRRGTARRRARWAVPARPDRRLIACARRPCSRSAWRRRRP